jgi:hypothetical protein
VLACLSLQCWTLVRVATVTESCTTLCSARSQFIDTVSACTCWQQSKLCLLVSGDTDPACLYTIVCTCSPHPRWCLLRSAWVMPISACLRMLHSCHPAAPSQRMLPFQRMLLFSASACLLRRCGCAAAVFHIQPMLLVCAWCRFLSCRLVPCLAAGAHTVVLVDV